MSANIFLILEIVAQNLYIIYMGKNKMSKEVKQEIRSVIYIIIGAIMAAFSVACILIPNDAIDYGTAGIGIIISQLTGFNLALCIFVVFAPFLFYSYFALGLEFFIKALLGSIVYTVGIQVFERVPSQLNTEHFIAVAFGGAILGGGLSIILKSGGCIDGSEIFANMIMKEGYDKIQLQEYITSHLEYEMLYYLNNKISGK